MLLYIIRHGDPDYATDSLTERGWAQAEAVGKRLAASGIDRVFSSPMGRAKQTAEPTCRLLGLDYSIEEWSHEIGDEHRLTPYPDGNLKSVSLVDRVDLRRGGAVDLDYAHAFDAPGFSESGMQDALDKISAGARDFLARLGYVEEDGVYRITEPNDDKVALFCHAGLGRILIGYLLHIPLHLMWAGFHYNHTGVTVMEFRNQKTGFTVPRMLCYSDTSHLYAHGPDMRYSGRFEI